jgi:ATP-dependent DNA helicase RecQ
VLFFNIKDRRTHRYFIAGRYRGVRTRLERKGLDAASIADRLREYEARRRSDEDKLERIIRYAQSPSCRWRALLNYFGDDVAADFRCGTCDACLDPAEWRIAPPVSADFPTVPDSPLPPPDRRRRRFKRGQKVALPRYGDGEIRGVDGDKIEVAFADGQVRKFKRDFLRASLRDAPATAADDDGASRAPGRAAR